MKDGATGAIRGRLETQIDDSEAHAGFVDGTFCGTLDRFVLVRQDSVANAQLLKMWKRVLHISQSRILTAAAWVNRLVPGWQSHTVTTAQNDRDVLARVVERDQAAHRVIFERYYKRVLAFVRRPEQQEAFFAELRERWALVKASAS